MYLCFLSIWLEMFPFINYLDLSSQRLMIYVQTTRRNIQNMNIYVIYINNKEKHTEHEYLCDIFKQIVETYRT